MGQLISSVKYVGLLYLCYLTCGNFKFCHLKKESAKKEATTTKWGMAMF
jgi:hypothetical protein